MFKKILVANRGEIAIRAFRAAFEVGARTVAVFPYEDRGSVHRLKADEAYQIGERGHPVRAYLNVDEIIRVALESGADAIYPGYGFLSENPELAEKAAAAGITFIGPPAQVLEMAGNKVEAKRHAVEAGVPVLRSTEASDDVEALVAQADEIGFPLFAKAVAEAAAAECAVWRPRASSRRRWRRPCARRGPRPCRWWRRSPGDRSADNPPSSHDWRRVPSSHGRRAGAAPLPSGRHGSWWKFP